jgi:hypothetical protein
MGAPPVIEHHPVALLATGLQTPLAQLAPLAHGATQIAPVFWRKQRRSAWQS